MYIFIFETINKNLYFIAQSFLVVHQWLPCTLHMYLHPSTPKLCNRTMFLDNVQVLNWFDHIVNVWDQERYVTTLIVDHLHFKDVLVCTLPCMFPHGFQPSSTFMIVKHSKYDDLLLCCFVQIIQYVDVPMHIYIYIYGPIVGTTNSTNIYDHWNNLKYVYSD